MSATASGRFSIRLIADAAISFAFLPVVELLAFAIVRRTAGRQAMPFGRSAGVFMIGNAPWLVWLAVVAALACLVPPARSSAWFWPAAAAAAVASAWSGRIDFWFFREVMGQSPRRAVRDLLLHRAIAWPVATAYFFGIAIWADVVPVITRWAGF